MPHQNPESVYNWSVRNKLTKYSNILQVIHVQKSVQSSLFIANYTKDQHMLRTECCV